MNPRVEKAAGWLGITEKQLQNLIGSGKVEARLMDEEIERARRLRELDPDFYQRRDGEGNTWVNSRYAAHLAHLCQEEIVRLVHKGELIGIRMGNTLEIRLDSLSSWLGERYPYLAAPGTVSSRDTASTRWPGLMSR